MASPPPQSHTPSQPPADNYPAYPTQTQPPARRQSQPEAYAAYPPSDMNTSYNAPPPSDDTGARPGHQPYPSIQPATIPQLQYQDEGKDYSPSNYSTDDLHHQNLPPPQQQVPHQLQQPGHSLPSQPSYAASAVPSQPYDYAPSQPPAPTQGPPPIPGSAPNPAHRPVTPLAQSSSYPGFSSNQPNPNPHQQYQAYNQRPTSVLAQPPDGVGVGGGGRNSYYR